MHKFCPFSIYLVGLHLQLLFFRRLNISKAFLNLLRVIFKVLTWFWITLGDFFNKKITIWYTFERRHIHGFILFFFFSILQLFCIGSLVFSLFCFWKIVPFLSDLLNMFNSTSICAAGRWFDIAHERINGLNWLIFNEVFAFSDYIRETETDGYEIG